MVCLRKLGDAADAEDALASISITVFEKLPWVHDRILNLRAWLVQVAVNHCVDVQRRRQRYSRLFMDEALGDEDAHWLASDAPTPDQRLLEHELWEITHSLIKALPPLLQEAADQHILKQLPYRQIADNLGVSQENVRKRIQKARDILWQQLYLHLDG
ncbi:MAG: sigma-70 family RNA polymerase sigma factor [Myxococcaceae bacterium]|nr:sigma-70 family RNA polymerase sigma factor [Myxococcaceae bacterium]